MSVVVMRVRAMTVMSAVGVCGRSHCQSLRLLVVTRVVVSRAGNRTRAIQRAAGCSADATVVAGTTSSRAYFLRAPSTQVLNSASLTTRTAIGI